MKLSCPSCGSNFDLDACVNAADSKRLAALLAALTPEVAKGLIQYLTLFRSPSGQLRASTQLKFADELVPMINAGRVRRDRQTFVVTHALWAEAFHYMASNPGGIRLPLKSNGYLLAVLAQLSDRMAAKAEQSTEKSRQSGHRDSGQRRNMAEVIEQHMREQWDEELKLGSGGD